MRFLAVFLGLFVAGCAGAPDAALGPAGRDVAVSSPQRTRSAPAGAARLTAIGLYRHPPAEALLRETVAELLEAAGRPNLFSSVTILDSGTFNAAVQGDRLYVTRGMLTLQNDRSEIAAVLAHEIGHAVAGHARQRIEARRQAIAAAADVHRQFRDLEITKAAVEIEARSLAAFGREQEHDADAIGIALMTKAGYDPQGAVRSLVNYQRMQTLGAALARVTVRSNASPLATHPPTPARIAAARALVARIGAHGGRTERAAYLSAISGMGDRATGTPNYLRGRTYISRTANFAFEIPPGFVPSRTRAGIGAIRRGGDATLVLLPQRNPNVAAEPEAALRKLVARLSTPMQVVPLRRFNGAMAIGPARGTARRLAIVTAGGKPFLLLMIARSHYPNLDKDFQTALAGVRTPTSRDLAIARPRRVDVVRARGPGDIARYARLGGDSEFGPQVLLALNGLSSAAQVRAGMQIKVLALQN
ncbi:MAG: M48 family metalloprotease [Beijerinckiaceae bacterium]